VSISAALATVVQILDDFLELNLIKQDLYKLLLGNYRSLCALGAEFLRDLEMMAPCFAFHLHKAYLMALAEAALQFAAKRRVLEACMTISL
jgi:hypothetical protein